MKQVGATLGALVLGFIGFAWVVTSAVPLISAVVGGYQTAVLIDATQLLLGALLLFGAWRLLPRRRPSFYDD